MTEKEKYLFWELGLTLALLITSVGLLKPSLFWQYQLFLVGGAVLGFTFGWYSRQGRLPGVKYLSDAAILIVLAWIGYRISKSSFLYKEVIALLTQGIIILEIIFTFNFSLSGKITYLRLLSLLVFMTSPIFAASYSIPLAVVYLLIWVAVLRFQFKGFLQPFVVKGAPRHYSLLASLACFFMALGLAWMLTSNIYLGRIKKGMLLVDEEMQDSDSGGGRDSNQANKFYSLQDDLQNKMTGLALKLDSYEKRRQLIYLFSELVKETLKTMEVDKAEIGLVDILKRQGAGLEGSAQAITLTRGYLDQKNSLNLQKNKEEIMDALSKYPLSIIDKIKIISLANKIQQANSYSQLQEYSQALQTAIQKALLNPDLQRDLGTLGRNLANLKAYQLYRLQMRSLEQESLALNEQTKKEVTEAVSTVGHAEGLEGIKQATKLIRQLKNDPRILGEQAAQDLLNRLEEAARIKLDLFFAQEAEKVRAEASANQNLGAGDKAEFDRKMDALGAARKQQEFIKELFGLSQLDKDNRLNLAQGLGQLLELKTESFKEQAKDKLDNLLKPDFFEEAKKEILKAIAELEEEDNFHNLEAQLEAISSKLQELESKGNLSPESAAQLLEAAVEFKALREAQLEAQSELKKVDFPKENSQKADYLEQLQQAIEDSFLSSREKEKLKGLVEQLFKTQNLVQLEQVKGALEEEISSLGFQGVVDQDRQSLTNTAQNIAKDLEQRIENLENVTGEQIQQLQDSLKKMQQSQDARTLNQAAAELAQEIKSNAALDKQEQGKMLESVRKLEEVLAILLKQKVLTAAELKEINKINEKIKQAIKIKEQFLLSASLAQILEKIESLSLQDAKKAQELKEKLEQLRESKDPGEIEEIILDLKDVLDTPAAPVDRQDALEQKEDIYKQQWKIYILSSLLVVTQGVTVPLKVIAVDKNGYIKVLNSDVEWFSTQPQVAWVDDTNSLYPLAKGKTMIKVVYKGSASKDTEVTVVEAINAPIVQRIKQELLR